MNIAGIYTVRDTPQPYYWDVVFEWEDEFAQTLQIPLIPVGEKYDKIYQPSLLKKVLNRLNYYQWKDKQADEPENYFLAFHMGVPGVYSFYTHPAVIPVIIDFWKHQDLKKFQQVFAATQAVVVTSKEVYNYLKRVGVSIKLEHVSLSLPDQHYQQQYHNKDIDVIQIGRQNRTLNVYMEQLLMEFPSINYVYTEKRGAHVTNVSTKYGALTESSTRTAFLKLLQRSKISLLSAPGIDIEEDRKRTGGFSPVTPRFLESAACGCHMVGLFPDNDDFKYYEVERACKKIEDYTMFRETILSNLKSDKLPNHQDFINKHLSSVKAQELKYKLLQIA